MARSGSNPEPAVGLPDDDVFYRCTVSMTDEDDEYPVTNLQDPDPALVTKASVNHTTITITALDPLGVPWSVTPVALAVFNTNAGTIHFNEGMAGVIPLTVPNRDPDDQRIHPWIDLTDLVAPASTFTITLSGPTSPSLASDPIWVGRISLIAIHGGGSLGGDSLGLRPLNLRYGLRYGRTRPGDVQIRTRLGSILSYPAGIRTRWAEGETGLLEDELLRHALEANTYGAHLPFLFIPDENTNSAWWVRHRANDYTVTIPDLDVRTIPFRVEELSTGPVNL